ncbi:hypothetical protein OROHE_007088 [Orobanche hederae]
MTYIKKTSKWIVWHFSSKLDVPSNVLQKKRVARILFFKIRPSQEILKIRDGTPLEVEEILTYIKKPRNGSFGTFLASYMSLVMYYRRKEWHGFWFSKLDHLKKFSKFKKRVARILVFKIRPYQEILKIRDGTIHLEKKRVARILFFKIWPSQEILKILLHKKRVARILVFKIRPSQEILKIRDVARILVFKIRPSQEILKIRDGTTLEKKRVARILVFKIRPYQEILKIRDGTTHLENKRKRVVRILVFKIRSTQEIHKIRDGTPLEVEEILTYIKKPRNGSFGTFLASYMSLVMYYRRKEWHGFWFSKLDHLKKFSKFKKRVARILVFKIRPYQEILKIRDDVPSNVLQKKRVARILFFKIWPSQKILKIRDGTPLEAEEILTYRKSPQNGSVWYFSSKLDIPSNVLQKKRVAHILVFKIRPSQDILKIRDGTPLEAEEILTYRKKPSKWIEILKIRDGHIKKFSKFVMKKRVAHILVFKIRPSQDILKIRDGTPLEAEEILTYRKKPSKWIGLNVPSKVLQKKRVVRILVFKIRSSQEIHKIRDGTPLEVEEILTYIKKPRNGSVWYFSSKLDIPSNVLQKKRVAHILVFKIRPSQEILKIRDDTHLEKKRVARILVFKIRPYQEILKIRDGTIHLEKFSKFVMNKRVARILVFKIRPSQEILKIRDGTTLEMPYQEILKIRDVKKRVVRILVFKIRSTQEIHKIRDGTPLEVEEILTYIKKPRNGSFGTFLASYMSLVMYYRRKEWHGFWFSKLDHLKKFSKFMPYQEILKIRDDVPSNVLQKKRVARILFFKIWPSQKILKIRDGTPLEAEEILTYRKSPQNGSVWYFSSKLDIPSNVLQKKRVAHILVFKIRPSQDILKIRDGTPLEAEEILTYRKKPSKWIVLQKKRVVRILVFKIRSSQEIHKIRDGTPLEVEEILTYIKKPRNGSFGTFLASYMSLVMYYRRKEWHGFWFSKLDHLKKFSKFVMIPIWRPYQEILKIRDVARILVFKIRPSQEILKIRDVARILVFKIRPSQEILKIRDEILKIRDVLQKKRVVRILVFKIRSTQEIHKIRDGTPLEVEEILTYIKKPRNGSFGTFLASYMSLVMYYRRKEWHGFWFSKLDHLKKFSKFKKRVARILFFKIWPSQKILKIRDGTPLEAEEILTYRKSPQNGSVWYFSSKLDIPSNVLQKKRVAHILVFKIRPSQDILKIRDGTPLEAEEILTYRKKPSKWIVLQKKRVVRILVFKIRSSQEIHKIRDGTPLEVEEILTYIKKPRNGSFGTFLASYMSLVMYYRRKEWHGFWFSKLDHLKKFSKFKKRVARILVFKIRPYQEILKIRDEPSQEILKIRDVARILVFKIRPSQEILKIRDEILKIRDDVPSKVLQKKRVVRILVFKIRSTQEIHKIRDGTPLEVEEILTYIKKPRNGSFGTFLASYMSLVMYYRRKEWHGFWFSKLDHLKKFSKFVMIPIWRVARILVFKIRPYQEILKIHVPSNVLQKKRVARILFFKIWPSQKILKIRDGTPLEAEEILTYRKSPQNGSVWYFSSKLDIPSNVLQKKRVAHILVFKIRPSQDILKIRDGTPLEAEEILTYRKKPSKWIVLQKKRVVRILVFKIRSSQEIHKIRDGTPLEVEEILTYIKKPRNGSFGTFLASYMSLVMYYRRKEWHGFWFSKLDHLKKFSKFKKRVARILVFKIRPYQEILKIRDGTIHLEKKRKFSKFVMNKRVARILVFKIRPSQEILKIRDEILKIRDVKKRVVRILVFKIRSTQEIHKIRDGTPLEVEEILTYIKKPRNGSFGTFLASYMSLVMYYRRKEWHGFWFSKLDHLKKFSKFKKRVARILKKRVARILFFKIWPSQKILKIRDGTPLEAEEILTYRKSPQNGSVWYFSSKLDIPSNVLQKKRVAHILVFKIRPSQDILKIRDGTPLEAEEILTYRKKPSKWIVLQKKRVVRILVFKIRSSQEIHKIRDGTPLEVEEILTYIKKPRNGSFGTFLASYMSLVMYYRRKEWHGFWFSKLDHLKKFSKFVMIPIWRVARILVFKIRPYQEILKIRDEVARILVFKIRPSQEILKIRDVARILVFKIRPSQEILKIRDVARILVFKIRPYQEILKIRDESTQEIHKIRDGTPLEVEEILTYIKKPRNGSFGTFLASYMSLVMYYRRKEWHGFWFSKLDHLKKFSKFKRVARILVFKIRPYQEILKIRDDVPSNVLQKKRVARILFFKIWPSQKILKIRDGTPLEAEEILTYRKSPQNGSVWYFSSKLDIPSNVLQKKRVAHILVFKIRPSQDILKIRDGTPLEAEEILTYRKKPSKWIVLQKKRVVRILVFKIRSSQEIHKIRDGTPLEVEEILTYIKKPRNGSFGTFLASYMSLVMYYRRKEWHGFWFSKLDHLKKFSKFVMIPIWRVARILVFKIRPYQEILKIRDEPSQEILKIRDVARILVFKIRPSQEILKIRDEILKIRDGTTHLEKKRVVRILVFKIRSTQEIHKIRDGTPLEVEEILTYIKKPRNGSFGTFLASYMSLVMYYRRKEWHGFWFSKLDHLKKFSKFVMIPIWRVKKRVARILFFKIWPSQKILKIRDGTPLEAEEILTYRKSPQNGSVWYFSSKLDIPSNVLQKKRVAHILVFKIRPSQDILKIRDGTPLEAEEILTYRKKPSKWIDVPSKVLQKKRVVRILVFKIRSSQEIHKIRDGTPLEVEEILTYIKKPRNGSFGTFLASYMSLVMYYRRKEWHGFWFSKLDHLKKFSKFKKRVARILVFKIRPYQEILKIRDVVRILVFKIRSSQEIHKIRDGTPLEVEEILTYIKKPRNGSFGTFLASYMSLVMYYRRKEWHGFWFSKLDHLKKFSKFVMIPIWRPYQEILKIRDVARILFFKIWPSQKILKIRDGTPLEAEEILTYRKSPQNGSVWYFSSKLDIPSNVLQKKRVAHILVFKIRPSQDILKIRDGTPLEAEEILTYRKKPSKWIVLQKKRVVRILVFKIRSSQEIHKIRDGTPLEVEEILTYIKKPRNGSFGTFLASYMSLVMYYRRKEWHGFWFSKLDHLKKFSKFKFSKFVMKKRVAWILFFKIWPSQEILKIRDGTPLEVEEILTYIKKTSKWIVWHFSSKLDVPSNVLQKKRVARILFFKIRPSQEILKIRDGTTLEKRKKRVVRILVFKIRSSQEIHKIRDGTPLEVEEILTYIKKPRNGSFGTFLASYMSLVMYYRRKEWHGFWFSKLDHLKKFSKFKKRVARILVFKIRPYQEILKIRDEILKIRDEPSQDILKIRDGTPLENKRVARILVFKIRPSQEILKIRDEILKIRDVAHILVFKIRPSQDILKIRDGTPLENKRVARILVFKIRPSQEILKIRDVARILVFKIRPYQEILKIRDDVPSNVLQKKRVARILFFKIWPSQKILKIRDGTPLEAEEILTYRKSPQNGSVWYFSSKLDIPSNVLQKKRVADILVFKIRPSQDILKIRDGTPLEAEEILTYRKKPSKWIDKLDVPSKVLQKKGVARILVFKIRPSQEILKIRDGTPLEVEEILTYIKKTSKWIVWHFSSKLDVPSNVLQKKRVARILFFKIRPSQEILKIRDGTTLEAGEILTYRKKPSKWIEILKIRDEILKIRDEIMTYIKKTSKWIVWHFSSKLDVPSNVLQKKRVARILFFKIRPSQEILKIRDGTTLEKKRVARILFFKIWPSQKILKIRDGTPLEAEEILTYRKSPQNGSVWYFSSKLDIPSNVLQKKRVAHILVFKIRPSQDILKIRDGTPLEAEEILTYRKKPSKWIEIHKIRDVARILFFKIWPSQEILKIRDGTPLELDVPSNVLQKKRVARILFFKIWPSQKILKIRDGTPLEAEEILTYRKSPQNGSVWYFSSKLDIPSNVLQKKRVAHILVFKIRPSQDILKIRDGTPLELDVPSKVLQKKGVARILVFKIRPSQEILKIRDGTPLEVEEILTYIKKTSKWIVWHFSSKLDVPSNVLQKKRVARILFFKIRPSQEILKIRDGTTLEAGEILTYRKKPSKWIEPSQDILKIQILKIRDEKKRVARILFFKIWPSQKILKIRDGTPLEAEEILTYRKSPQNGSVWYFSSKLDIPSNVLQKKRVAHILVFKIRPSQDILKIRDGTPLEKRVVRILVFKIRSTQEIHKIRDGTPLELDVPSNVLQKKRVARILFFKIWPSQKILKIRDGTPLEAEEILTYRKSPQNGSVWYFSSKLDIPSNVLQKKRVAHILVFKIRPSQDILKIRDGTPLEKKRVARILFFKIWPSQKILKIRDGTPLEAEEILTYRKSPQNGSVWYFSSKLDIPSNVLQKKRVAHILVFKIRPSQDILKIRDGTPLELDVPSKVLQKKGVARILVFKIRPSQEILKIRDGTPLEVEEILTYIKKTSKWIVWHFSSKLDVPSNVLQKKRVARILFFKIRPSQEILKIRDGTTLEAGEILTYRKKPSKWIEILKIRDV